MIIASNPLVQNDKEAKKTMTHHLFAQTEQEKKDLNVNFKTIRGKTGYTIRPLTVDERRTTELQLGLRS